SASAHGCARTSTSPDGPNCEARRRASRWLRREPLLTARIIAASTDMLFLRTTPAWANTFVTTFLALTLPGSRATGRSHQASGREPSRFRYRTKQVVGLLNGIVCPRFGFSMGPNMVHSV